MIHYESNVLTYDELVVVRDFLRKKTANTPATIPSTSTNNTTTTRSNDTYVYDSGILAVLAIGVCVFFTYNTFQPKNKKLVNEKRIKHQKDVICFTKNIQ